MSKSKKQKKTAAAVSNNPLNEIRMGREDNPYTKLMTKETKQNDTIDKNNILGSMTQETKQTKQNDTIDTTDKNNILNAFNFSHKNEDNPDFNPNNITEKLTNQIIELLNNPNLVYENDPELLNDPSHNLSMYIIDKCYDWIDVTLQPIAISSAYLVKNTIITVTVPFSLMFNDVTTLLMAGKQATSLVNEIKNFNILNIISKKKEPTPNFLSPYIENSEAEIQNIKTTLNNINLFRIQIKNSILHIVNLIIDKLREIKMDDTTKKEKITEFIDALENTKEDKSNEVAESVFTTFSEVIFGYKSIKQEKDQNNNNNNNKGGKLRLFLHSGRTIRRRQRQRRTARRRTARRQRQRTTRRRTTRRRTARRQRQRTTRRQRRQRR